LLYKSTRGGGNLITASKAIIKGISEDGGLFVPTEFPKIDKPFNELSKMTYKEIAFYVMKKFLTDFTDEELDYCIRNAYNEKFESKDIVPITYKSGVYFLELYHGRTLAFKDMALSILPYFMKTAAKKNGIDKEIVILTATSGDTGKAALEGFANVEGTKVAVFYPKYGVSDIQERQMITQEGDNTFVVGIEGNFDDAQSAVKKIFTDIDYNNILNENGYMLSSANSINIGRLVPQIVYYVYAYVKLLSENKIKDGEFINVAVPTGNFGNILAAYYAKKMGIPIGKLICASNKNNVLTDFINSGIYDCNRDFFVTNSPSMDILISSNLERFLYEISKEDSDIVREYMKDLMEKGKYEITDSMKERMNILYGGYANEDETLSSINKVYKNSNYVIDPHTAVAYFVYEKYKKETGDENTTIIASTASPFKFPRSINDALNFTNKDSLDCEMINELSNKFNLQIPSSIKDLYKKEVKHTTVCKKDELKKVISMFLGV